MIKRHKSFDFWLFYKSCNVIYNTNNTPQPRHAHPVICPEPRAYAFDECATEPGLLSPCQAPLHTNSPIPEDRTPPRTFLRILVGHYTNVQDMQASSYHPVTSEKATKVYDAHH